MSQLTRRIMSLPLFLSSTIRFYQQNSIGNKALRTFSTFHPVTTITQGHPSPQPSPNPTAKPSLNPSTRPTPRIRHIIDLFFFRPPVPTRGIIFMPDSSYRLPEGVPFALPSKTMVARLAALSKPELSILLDFVKIQEFKQKRKLVVVFLEMEYAEVGGEKVGDFMIVGVEGSRIPPPQRAILLMVDDGGYKDRIEAIKAQVNQMAGRLNVAPVTPDQLAKAFSPYIAAGSRPAQPSTRRTFYILDVFDPARSWSNPIGTDNGPKIHTGTNIFTSPTGRDRISKAEVWKRLRMMSSLERDAILFNAFQEFYNEEREKRRKDLDITFLTMQVDRGEDSNKAVKKLMVEFV
ncbi:hypothetical protein BJ508DRAFT_360625 [Ascobolus immersus RN42]|uniref:Uncharacterized protein n=1 Tax=Ascobolus immersus RN42 TaxID=1160509 RepID=A0A3N4IEM1_ASCIM|nr:hypothetical protein BJ508DRAFT_360625 [Ascobolus immersus RN42]